MTSSPYFKYPKVPTTKNRIITTPIPTFNTPKDLLNCSGFFISFCNGNTFYKNNSDLQIFSKYTIKLTKPIPSKAKSAVPKKRGNWAKVDTKRLSLSEGRSCTVKYSVITIPVHIKMLARVENGAKYLRFLTRELKSIGNSTNAICKWTSNTIP